MRKALAGGMLAWAVVGCGGVDLWPFGTSEQERSRVPANAMAYKCDGERALYVRYLDNGEAAWVILPEREFRLDRVASASGVRYTNGAAVLDTQGAEARFADGAVSFNNCRSER